MRPLAAKSHSHNIGESLLKVILQFLLNALLFIFSCTKIVTYIRKVQKYNHDKSIIIDLRKVIPYICYCWINCILKFKSLPLKSNSNVLSNLGYFVEMDLLLSNKYLHNNITPQGLSFRFPQWQTPFLQRK